MEGRVQEIQLQKFIMCIIIMKPDGHVTPLLHTVINFMGLQGLSPHLVRIFRTQRNRSLIGARLVLTAPCIHALRVLQSHRFMRLEAGPDYRVCTHIMVAVTMVLMAVWTPDCLKYYILKDR